MHFSLTDQQAAWLFYSLFLFAFVAWVSIAAVFVLKRRMKHMGIYSEALDRRCRQQSRYIIYLQARLTRHGVTFEQELEWTSNEEHRQFDPAMDH